MNLFLVTTVEIRRQISTLYTDGSQLDKSGPKEAGIHSKLLSSSPFSLRLHRTLFDGEINQLGLLYSICLPDKIPFKNSDFQRILISNIRHPHCTKSTWSTTCKTARTHRPQQAIKRSCTKDTCLVWHFWERGSISSC